jgi:hypothetical protein
MLPLGKQQVKPVAGSQSIGGSWKPVDWLAEFRTCWCKASRRRHFEGITAFPYGLLPFGDTICHFNPVYGQGMSAAAEEACLLRDQLSGASSEGKGINGLAATFLAEAQKLIETSWSSSAIPDLLDPLTEEIC